MQQKECHDRWRDAHFEREARLGRMERMLLPDSALSVDDLVEVTGLRYRAVEAILDDLIEAGLVFRDLGDADLVYEIEPAGIALLQAC